MKTVRIWGQTVHVFTRKEKAEFDTSYEANVRAHNTTSGEQYENANRCGEITNRAIAALRKELKAFSGLTGNEEALVEALWAELHERERRAREIAPTLPRKVA